MNQIISAASALTPDGGLAPYWIRTGGGRVVDAGYGAPPEAVDLHLEQGTLSPGFVDVHAHGGGGASFTEGTAQARDALEAHRSRGTTTMVASLVSAPVELMLQQTEQLRPLVAAGELAAVHWEGPWLSDGHRGAHDATALSAPSADAVSALLGHPAAELVRCITLAPELPGGLEAIRRLRGAGMVIGVGHTGADCAATRQALLAGATAATHLFNAMTGLHHREPGAALALLESPDAFLELICDGVHLHPEMIRYAWRTAERNGGSQRIVLVSDAMAAAAARDGDYTLGRLAVQVQDGVARVLTADGRPGAIAGSTLTLAEAVRCSIAAAGIAPADALAAATVNPARMAGLDDVGQLAPGRRADLVVLNDQWEVQHVMRRGEWLS
ncbi:amidohydrolase family protein [Nesterenkonia sp.]|uniref:N-acetylglucosamine-6-phosphate deacetylase n=1 Tax=Nesterenkonia sp. TaxID=704201 RepID=UPI002638B4B8|nr:amidohydrolase family protein [Nesterenkonia sp.]